MSLHKRILTGVCAAALRRSGAIYDYHETEFSDAVISALEAAGYVVVPKEPTEAMLDAASRARPYREDSGERDGEVDSNSEMTWHAMIAAAGEKP